MPVTVLLTVNVPETCRAEVGVEHTDSDVPAADVEYGARR